MLGMPPVVALHANDILAIGAVLLVWAAYHRLTRRGRK